MPKEIMIKKILQYLDEQPGGQAESVNIIKELSLEISIHEYDKLIEEMYHRDLIIKPKPQMMSHSEPHYDLIWISDNGKEYL